MHNTTKSYIKAVATLMGTTIGAGIFGVPYVINRAGVLVGMFWIVLIGTLLIVTNLLYGEFTLRTRDDLKFVGIAHKYLSKFWGRFAGILTVVSFYGSILAYIIIGGQFFNTLVSPIFSNNLPLHTLIYFLITSLVIYKGIGFLEDIELPLVVLLLLSIIVFSIYNLQHIDISNFTGANWSNVLMPYGVILFSLGSMSAITTIEEVLDKNKKRMRSVIIVGGIISIVIVMLFALSIVGVSGDNTSPEAIYGLTGFLGGGMTYYGAIVGFFAIITSHLVIGFHLKEIFQYDYKFSKIMAWGLAVLIPYLIYILANVSFILVIGFLGGVLGGIFGILVGVIAIKSHDKKTREPEYVIKYYNFWSKTVIIIFSIGIVYQLYYSIFN